MNSEITELNNEIIKLLNKNKLIFNDNEALKNEYKKIVSKNIKLENLINSSEIIIEKQKMEINNLKNTSTAHH